MSKLCQLLDFPFIPTVWFQFEGKPIEQALNPYFSFFATKEEFDSLDWKTYNDAFTALREKGTLEEEIPILSEKKKRELVAKWGAYSQEEYEYLEDLYRGILSTQPMTGPLIEDNAKKICLTLMLINGKIREGEEFDKLLKSYDSLMKIAGFSAKESKESGEIESVGEVAPILKKRGWMNNYHDEPKDIVDLTMKEIQLNNQRLYTNEPGIGEEITARIENLKNSKKLEEIIGEEDEYKPKMGNPDIDYKDPFLIDAEEDFTVDMDGEEDDNGD